MSHIYSILHFIQQRILFSVIALTTTSLLSTTGLASGASLIFLPVGAQLDADPILDISTAVGAPIRFVVFLDTTGLGGPLNLTYSASWDGPALNLPGDANELSFTHIGFAPGAFGGAVGDVGNDGLRTITYAGLPAGLIDMLTVFDFMVQPGLVSDGLPDFGIGFGTATVGGVNVIPFFNPLPQIVEVQPFPALPVPQPSTYVLLSSGLLGILCYVWRKRGVKS